jgi:hypothetical protein
VLLVTGTKDIGMLTAGIRRDIDEVISSPVHFGVLSIRRTDP